MRRSSLPSRSALAGRSRRGVRHASVQSSAASSSSPAFRIDLPQLNGHGPFAESPLFQVIGSPFSLLNASIPSRSALYTRRGSLIGINGNVQNITSTLSIFNSGVGGALARAVGNMPFLYQKIQSDSAFTALIGTKSSATSFAVLELDGRYDWNITAKDALLAWSGVLAQVRRHGIDKSLLRTSSNLTGRGSAVIAGNGQIYQIVLEQGDIYIVHPTSVLAFAVSCPDPQPVKLRPIHISPPFKMPSLSAFLLRYEFFQVMSKQTFWRRSKQAVASVRAFFSRVVWGDQLFVQFQGPTTILLQSRSRLAYEKERPLAEVDPVPDTQNPTPTDPGRTYSGSLKIATVEKGKVILTDTTAFTNQ